MSPTEETGFPAEPESLFPWSPPKDIPSPEWDDLRRRIDEALDASIDRCARCKVCDAQLDAVMAVLWRASVQYAVAWGGDVEAPGTTRIEIYDDEEDARDHVAAYAPAGYVVRRTLASTRWERVPAQSGEAGNA